METNHPKQSHQQNTLQILITHTPSTACTKSFKQLYEEHQQNSKASFLRWLDIFILKLIHLIRVIWNVLPRGVRGSSNEGEVFASYVQKMNTNIPNNLVLSHEKFQTSLRKNGFALMLAYTCNDYIKRDVKKLLNNKKMADVSQKYPLCPLNNYSQYFNKHIKPNIPKAYSIYLILFGINLLSEIMLLDIYKPIDETIGEKIDKAIQKFKEQEKQMLNSPVEPKAVTPKVRQRHFSIPKILELGDFSFPNESQTKSQDIE